MREMVFSKKFLAIPSMIWNLLKIGPEILKMHPVSPPQKKSFARLCISTHHVAYRVIHITTQDPGIHSDILDTSRGIYRVFHLGSMWQSISQPAGWGGYPQTYFDTSRGLYRVLCSGSTWQSISQPGMWGVSSDIFWYITWLNRILCSGSTWQSISLPGMGESPQTGGISCSQQVQRWNQKRS